ncbi:ATP-binding protein [Streptomyces rectiverticillatus]|uniref:ATP-binding protein n=1 Tax=Streptomyces rectiverticillatus TaxID=173860 RepID=UPI0015C3D3D1|nr:ATP-binding protein [Streptomyces rectiverticillatus]QLE73639.1 ATP-binding protein [Streptomyces rectiverticillatus]
MKLGTFRTLGAAALGVAFAAAAAGSAQAAGSAGAVESLTTTARTTTAGLPIQQVAQVAPAGGPVVSAADRAIQSGMLQAPAQAVDKAVAPQLPTQELAPKGATKAVPADNKGNGGLLAPLSGLPLGSLPVSGIGG